MIWPTAHARHSVLNSEISGSAAKSGVFRTLRTHGRRRSYGLIVLAIAGAAFPATAQTLSSQPRVSPEFRTQPRSLVTQRVDRNRLATTPGAVHPESSSAQDLGPRDPAASLEHLQFVLRRPAERQAAFDAEVAALHQPGNPSYHQWLTPQLVGSEFGPSAADLAALTGYLQTQGFTVNAVANSGMFVDFTGTVAQVQSSFHTQVHNLRLPSGEQRYSAVSDAQIPDALVPLVAGFLPISNILPHSLIRHAQAPDSPTPNNSTGGSYDVGAQDFYTIYNENPLLTAGINGAGITVALLEQSDVDTADVTTFRTNFGVMPATPSLTVMHGAGSIACSAPGKTSDEDEAVLDVEWAGAVAPMANLLFMSCAQGVYTSAEAVIDNALATTLSLSYGNTEVGFSSTNTLFSDLWQQAAAQGETVVVSAGDAGSANSQDQNQSVAVNGLAVNGLGSSDYNVAAGGTDFQDTYNADLSDSSFTPSTYWLASNNAYSSSAISYVAETTWNNSCANSTINFLHTASSDPNALCNTGGYLTTAGAGGGVSIQEARPSWQNATVYGMPAASGVYNFRLLPDLSLFAANGFWGHALDYYQSDAGGTSRAGGTSFVAPQLAGLFALIAQHTGQPLGQPNYVLYNMAATEYGTSSYIAGSTCNGSGASGTGVTTTAPASTCIFYDVQTGNNTPVCGKSGGVASPNCYIETGQSYGILSQTATPTVAAYPATQGYDMATGLGSVNIANLVNNWDNSAAGGVVTTPTVAVTSTASTAVYGSSSAITYTATVTGNTTTVPTGSVTFFGSPVISTIGTDTLTAGSGCTSTPCTAAATQAFVPASTAVGTYTIFGAYTTTNATAIYTTASGSTPLTITQQTPSLTVNAVSVAYGVSANLIAKLAYTGSGTKPTGSVHLQVDSGTIATATCTGSSSPLTCTASGYSTASLAVGTHTITATYAGDTNYTAQTATGVLTITQQTPTVTVSPVSIAYGAAANLTATIAYTGSGSAPTGGLTFKVGSGSTVTATCTGSSSPLTCTYTGYPTSSLAPTTYTITATYAGDTNYATRTSTANLTVTQQTPTVTVSPVSIVYGTSTANLSATIAYTGSGSAPTGGLTFKVSSGSTVTATCTGSSTPLTCTYTGYSTAALTAGTYTITATSLADTNYAAKASTANLTVTQQTPTVTVSPVAISYGSNANLSATIAYTASAKPTGGLTFKVGSGSTVTATCTGSSTPLTCTYTGYPSSTFVAGGYTIIATSLADTNYAAQTGTNTLTVNAIAPTITFTVPTHHTMDTPFTVAAASNSAGVITYSYLSGPAGISGSTVTLTGAAGTVMLQASQAANGGYTSGTQTVSFSVIAGSVWLGNGNGSLSPFDLTGNPITGTSLTGGGVGTIGGPLGLAFDSAGNAWVASSNGVSEFSRQGVAITSTALTTGGITSPAAVAVDGAGQIWVANSNGTVSVLNSAGTAISQSVGYPAAGTGAAPSGIAVDISGNVWVSNRTANTVTRILGAATPVVPLATGAASGPGGKP